jgi:DNA-binding NarL/FixJ family response regulator
MTESPLSNNERRFLAFILIAIVLFVAADLINDSAEGVQWSHLFVELTIALGAAVGFFVLMKNSLHKSHQLVQSQETILEREKEVERWKLESQKYIQGLSIAIDSQLARWSLSPSEKEVALLILKGLSLKEIAQLRNTAEKTVRSQSVSIYSKSGLNGRSELAAFFLEDLLVPQNKL